MPIYEFECSTCKTIFEKICPMSDKTKEATCMCGGKGTKVISRSDFYLKGGGWAADGYVSKMDSFKNNMKAVDNY